MPLKIDTKENRFYMALLIAQKLAVRNACRYAICKTRSIYYVSADLNANNIICITV